MSHLHLKAFRPPHCSFDGRSSAGPHFHHLGSKYKHAALALGLQSLFALMGNALPQSQPPQLGASSSSAAQEAKEIRPLRRRASVERKIADESHFYEIDLTSGQFLRLVVDQRGVDLVVKLFDAKGTKRVEVDSPNSAWGPEHLLFVADESGSYRVEVRLLQAYAPAAAYRIAIAEQRTATQEDRTRAVAQQHYAQGNELVAQGTAQSLANAVKQYEQALRFQKISGDRRGEACTLVYLATVHLYLGESDKGINYLNQALPLWRAMRDRGGEAVTLNNLGYSYDQSGERQKAIHYFIQALRLFRVIGDKREQANIFNNIGKAYVSLGEYQKALDYLNRSLPYFRATKNPSAASVLANISVVYESFGEYEKAIGYINEALPLLREAADRRGEGSALLSGGVIFLGLAKYHEALEQFNRGLQILEAVGDRQNQARALNFIGKAHILFDEYQKALEPLHRALSLARDVKDKTMEAYILNNIGLIYTKLGETQKALDLFDQALPLLRETNDPHGQALIFNNTGSAFVSLGNKQRALDSFMQALAINREIKERADEGNTLGNLMIAWRTFGNPRLAIFYGKQAVNTFQEIRTNIHNLEKELQASYVKSKENVYRELTDLLIAEGRLFEAEQVLNLLKQEEYFRFIRRDAAKAPSLSDRATLTPEEAAWASRYGETTDRLMLIAGEYRDLLEKKTRTSREEDRLNRLEENLRTAQAAFDNFLNQLFVESGKSELAKSRIFHLEEAQGLMGDLRELGSRVVALYTVVGEEKYRLILITPEVRKAFEYPIKASDLYRKVQAFREVLQDPRLDPLPLAKELYGILVGPLANELRDAKAETLMWSLDGVLRYIPISALHDGERYLIERYRNVVFTPASKARLKELPRVRWTGLGLGVSKAYPPLSELPAVQEELSMIIRDETLSAGLQGAMPGKVLINEAFTERAMRAALHEKYPVVHIASHFAFHPINEADSFLLLGDGKRLTLADIKTSVNLFEGVDLLTLSACDTATSGASADGKEVECFAVLAQRQGAKAVVASLWPVVDWSTRFLMEKFYRLRNAQPALPKAEALRLAQLTLLYGDETAPASREGARGVSVGKGDQKNDARSQVDEADNKPPYSHPFFWAPFILIGNWK